MPGGETGGGGGWSRVQGYRSCRSRNTDTVWSGWKCRVWGVVTACTSLRPCSAWAAISVNNRAPGPVQRPRPRVTSLAPGPVQRPRPRVTPGRREARMARIITTYLQYKPSDDLRTTVALEHWTTLHHWAAC